MSKSIVGWLWVAGQAILLVTLVLVDDGQDWPTPRWLELIATTIFVFGFVIVGVAALRLGAALTPTPVPNQRGSLTTTGLYRYARHPIYTGVLAIVVGMTLGSGRWLLVAVAIGTVVFFDRKAAWEEQQLHRQYPDYADYVESTPRFIPNPWRRSTSG